MASISVVINTYNAQRVLRECLSALSFADEIIICDMHSEDDTVKIAQEFGCKIIYHEKLKDIPKILETPYYNEKAPYKEEISMLRSGVYKEGWRN